MHAFRIPVPEGFRPFVDRALVRLGYLYAQLDWGFDAESQELIATLTPGCDAPDATAVKREALFQLYRERIFHDTLPIRERIYEAIK